MINPHRRLFRKTAFNLGLSVRVKSGGSWKTRPKADILAEYDKKVAQTKLARGSAPDPCLPSLSSIQSASLSEAVAADLEATGNITDFRKLARAFGLVTHFQNSDGQWCVKPRADILKECRKCNVEASMFASGHVLALGRDGIRALAAELRVNRYQANTDGSGRNTWRCVADLREDCKKALFNALLPQKKPLPSLFERQRQNWQVPGNERNDVSVS